MGLNCGIVGLPNVGKSTLFQALTASAAEAANYPFCTIEPNVGLVKVKDKRLEQIAGIFNPEKVIPSVVEFVDIAGLVRGASKGEGLGNQFLGHIRQVGAICHVVRCFEDPNVVHVHGKLDPLDDIDVINIELALADLETVNKRFEQLGKLMKSQNKDVVKKAQISKPILEKLKEVLGEGKPARALDLSDEDLMAISDLHLLTLKKQLYVCNVDETISGESEKHVESVRQRANSEGSEVITICGKVESELLEITSEEEKKEFMESLGIEESGIDKLIRAGHKMLGLRTYFTAGPKEVRAWTFNEGMKAPQAAGVIHTDFERGFIKAEVYTLDDLVSLGSELKVKENGKMRIEGKDYVVKDGDIIHFRFNV